MKFFDEFKEFIAKGNAIDMAVGVVVGGAFTAIVNSLVTDILTPVISLVTKLFQSKVTSVASGVAGNDAEKLLNMSNWIIPGTSINVGSFLQAVISFLMIAFVLFCIVKGINTMRDRLAKKEEIAEPEAPAAPTQEELLAEIRDLLQEQNSKDLVQSK